jgi:DNA-binding phage protein
MERQSENQDGGDQKPIPIVFDGDSGAAVIMMVDASMEPLVRAAASGGSARVLAAWDYTNFIAVWCDLAIVDPTRLSEQEWCCLCELFSSYVDVQFKMLLVKPSPYKASLPGRNVVHAPAELSVDYGMLWVMQTEKQLASKLTSLLPHLDERARRLVAAAEAMALKRGGVSAVCRSCGMSRTTITAGIRELREGAILPAGRIRREGGGRKPFQEKHPDFAARLNGLVCDSTRGDPESALLWTCKSTRRLAAELARGNLNVSHETIAQSLRASGYSLQGNRKTEEDQHPDRDAQFLHINATVSLELAHGRPVISVDTKKKELVGNYENKGKQWLPKGQAKHVNGHDFPGPDVPRAFPYGVYDLGQNTGFVNVGTDNDTATFAVASIRGWWRAEGRRLYPKTPRPTITADGGGSNGYRLRLWKLELQKLADDTGLEITVCHFPPGTSKWNKVEHRLFSFISSNWRGEPLRDYETIVSLIARTTTAKGLKVRCRLDRRRYAVGTRVSDKDLSALNISRAEFHGEWNYTIRPSAKSLD